MKLLILTNYIDRYHNGNKAEFARSIDRTPQYVTQLLNQKKAYYVVVTDKSVWLVAKQMEIKSMVR